MALLPRGILMGEQWVTREIFDVIHGWNGTDYFQVDQIVRWPDGRTEVVFSDGSRKYGCCRDFAGTWFAEDFYDHRRGEVVLRVASSQASPTNFVMLEVGRLGFDLYDWTGGYRRTIALPWVASEFKVGDVLGDEAKEILVGFVGRGVAILDLEGQSLSELAIGAGYRSFVPVIPVGSRTADLVVFETSDSAGAGTGIFRVLDALGHQKHQWPDVATSSLATVRSGGGTTALVYARGDTILVRGADGWEHYRFSLPWASYYDVLTATAMSNGTVAVALTTARPAAPRYLLGVADTDGQLLFEEAGVGRATALLPSEDGAGLLVAIDDAVWAYTFQWPTS